MTIHTTLLVTPDNCQAVIGLPWRHIRDHYRHLARKIGKKLVIPADELISAIRSLPAGIPLGVGGREIPVGDAVPELDSTESIRAALGKVRR